jgi:hypothetical protein
VSECCGTVICMELTTEELTRIPWANIRIPEADFVAVWTAAETAAESLRGEKTAGWDVWGVARTCRWLAGADSRLDGQRFSTLSPATKCQITAYPEVIVREARRAEVLAMSDPRPRWLQSRDGYIDAVVATFRWAWGGSGCRPLPETLHAAS